MLYLDSRAVVEWVNLWNDFISLYTPTHSFSAGLHKEIFFHWWYFLRQPTPLLAGIMVYHVHRYLGVDRVCIKNQIFHRQNISNHYTNTHANLPICWQGKCVTDGIPSGESPERILQTKFDFWLLSQKEKSIFLFYILTIHSFQETIKICW